MRELKESEGISLKGFERSDVFLTMDVALALLAEQDSFDPPPRYGGGSKLQRSAHYGAVTS
jgi:hypothetical protein